MKAIAYLLVLLMLQGCTTMIVGTTVGAVTTLAVETAKVPFKVAGAAIDVVTDDEDEDE
jgi:ABC-type methionine transport system permease subunit